MKPGCCGHVSQPLLLLACLSRPLSYHNFPYYNDEKGAGVLVPRRLAQAGQHAFRYTYVGPRCRAAAPHG